jgi:hypothetical protein
MRGLGMKAIDLLGIGGFLFCLALALYFASLEAAILSLVAAICLLLLGFIYMIRKGGTNPNENKAPK